MPNKTTTTVRRRKTVPAPKQAPEPELVLVGKPPGTIKFFKGVFFGPPKTAKTTVACSGKKVLLINFDPDGDTTETLAGRDDIVVMQPRTRPEIEAIIKALHGKEGDKFDWVVVDSLTFLFLLLGGKEITDTWKDNKDIRRAYGRAGAAVQQIVHDLVVLNKHVIFTAHLEKVDTEDEDGVPIEQKLGENEVKVAVSPMVWKILGPAVSFIGRTFKENVYEKEGKKRNKRTRYVVSFNDGDRSPAGSRLPMQGEYEIELDTLTKLADTLIQGGS
jgi:hypothetical protein